MNKWIYTKDKLPVENELVICYSKSKGENFGWYSGDGWIIVIDNNFITWYPRVYDVVKWKQMNKKYNRKENKPKNNDKYKVLCDGKALWNRKNIEMIAKYEANSDTWYWEEEDNTYDITDYVIGWNTISKEEKLNAIVDDIEKLRRDAYNWNVNDKVLGMNCSDFEQLMTDIIEVIKNLPKEKENKNG